MLFTVQRKERPLFAGDLLSDVASKEKRSSNPCTGLDAPKFPDNQRLKVVRFSALCTDSFYSQERLLVRISVGGRVDLRAVGRAEEISQ
jgi:hypothetical protein